MCRRARAPSFQRGCRARTCSASSPRILDEGKERKGTVGDIVACQAVKSARVFGLGWGWGRGRSAQLIYLSLLGDPAVLCGSGPPSPSRRSCQGTWTLVEARRRWQPCSQEKHSRKQIQVDGVRLPQEGKQRNAWMRTGRIIAYTYKSTTDLVLRCKTPAYHSGSHSDIGKIRPRPGYICNV